MPKDIFDETGKKIGVSHRNDLEDRLVEYLEKYPDMIELIEPLFPERRNRDLANDHLKHTSADNIEERVKITKELEEKAFAFFDGYYLHSEVDGKKFDPGSQTGVPRWISAADYKTWILNGIKYKEKENLIPEKDRNEISVMTARVLMIIVVDKFHLDDGTSTPPPFGD